MSTLQEDSDLIRFAVIVLKSQTFQRHQCWTIAVHVALGGPGPLWSFITVSDVSQFSYRDSSYCH